MFWFSFCHFTKNNNSLFSSPSPQIHLVSNIMSKRRNLAQIDRPPKYCVVTLTADHISTMDARNTFSHVSVLLLKKDDVPSKVGEILRKSFAIDATGTQMGGNQRKVWDWLNKVQIQKMLFQGEYGHSYEEDIFVTNFYCLRVAVFHGSHSTFKLALKYDESVDEDSDN